MHRNLAQILHTHAFGWVFHNLEILLVVLKGVVGRRLAGVEGLLLPLALHGIKNVADFILDAATLGSIRLLQIAEQIYDLLIVQLHVADIHIVRELILLLQHLVEQVLDRQVAEARMLQRLQVRGFLGLAAVVQLTEHGVRLARGRHSVCEAGHVVAFEQLRDERLDRSAEDVQIVLIIIEDLVKEIGEAILVRLDALVALHRVG